MIRRRHTSHDDASTVTEETARMTPLRRLAAHLASAFSDQHHQAFAGSTSAAESSLANPLATSPELARSAEETVQGSPGVGAMPAAPGREAEEAAVYVKSLPSANPQSRSDSSWGLAEGPATPAESPLAGTTRTAKSPTRHPRLRSLSRRVAITAATLVAIAAGTFLTATPALAAGIPAWRLLDTAIPTYFHPANDYQSGGGEYMLKVENVGDAPANPAEPIEVVDRLPAGLKATVAGTIEYHESIEEGAPPWNCEITEPSGVSTVTCTYEGEPIQPVTFDSPGPFAVNPPRIGIYLEVTTAQLGEQLSDEATLSGGGASESAADSAPATISESPVPFGIASLHQWATNVDGTPDLQAGSHPYEFTTYVMFNLKNFSGARAESQVRDVHVQLPPGFIGNPNSTPRCTHVQFDAAINTGLASQCPADTQVGTAQIYLFANEPVQLPLYNLVPPRGVPAELGFGAGPKFALLNAGVHPGSYNLTIDTPNISDTSVSGFKVSVWGEPSDPSHDAERFTPGIPGSSGESGEPPIPYTGEPKEPFLSLPTSCGGPQALELSADDWLHPAELLSAPAAWTDQRGESVLLGGCNQLNFDPTIESLPTTNLADSPSGLDFDLHVPQQELEELGGHVQAHLKDTTVTLPKGFVLNPSSANGLGSCTPEQIGLTSEPGVTPVDFNGAAATCPNAAKLGTVEVDTPLIGEHPGEHPLKGAVYLAKPFANPFKSLLAIYAAIEDPATGIVIKLAGHVAPDPQTGQLTTTFDHNPQLPFEDFHFDFFGGARAALKTPPTCGTYATTADLTPWSSPEGADAFPESSFETTAEPGGGACPRSAAQQQNAPSFSAGTASTRQALLPPSR